MPNVIWHTFMSMPNEIYKVIVEIWQEYMSNFFHKGWYIQTPIT